MAEVLTKKHKAALGAYKTSRGQAVELEAGILARARQLEKQLMAEGKRLSDRLKRAPSAFARRRLEQQYLETMHRLSAVRRSMALSRATQERLGSRGESGGEAVRKGLASVGVRFSKHLAGKHDQESHGRRYVSGWRDMKGPKHIWRIGRLDPERLAKWRKLKAGNLEVVLTADRLRHIVEDHPGEQREQHLDSLPDVLLGPNTEIWRLPHPDQVDEAPFVHLAFMGRARNGQRLLVAVRMQKETTRFKHSVWTLHVTGVRGWTRKTQEPDAVRIWPV